MLGSIFGSIGGSVGKYFGGGILSTLGRYVGRHLGNYLEQKWFHKKQVFHKYASIKESFTFSSAVYGAAIPLVFGKMRVPGKIIWSDKIQNVEETSSSSVYFPKPGILPLPKIKKSTTHYTNYKYFLSFAMCICEGEIVEISRIWNGNELVDISNYNFRLYKGGPNQMPDSYINAKMNGKAPGFRDLAYIVFENLPLADFENMIPNLSFEVTRKPNVLNRHMVEDIVESMIMIPGSGEYVYDTIVQSKTILGPNDAELYSRVINSHNIYNLPNSIQSLNQLSSVCENIKWIAPVVCWFGDSTDLTQCLIRPAIEFRDDYVRFSEEWKVGNYNRDTAYEIRKDEKNNPIYGGSINDQSVLRYLTELRNRGFKIMFYPMFFMDVHMKPWRGHLTGNPSDVSHFFNKEQGYNEFILHYANLVKNHVDAFLIGTELIGLTKIKDSNNNFPAVNEFIVLAEKVKNIVGDKVLVSYAADWSEYHHTEGGWYNLDPLWASNNIDFIGIDAYFPVTDTQSSFISNKELETGFSSGECYDYYMDWKENKKYPLDPKYALKNLKYWWENNHINPNNEVTPWQPKSKNIWFTEYGFPSINKSPNQPNVFFDPFCSDGGAPRYSNEEIDFPIQRRCIRAFIEYWGAQEYVDNMFLWTWDARPYPAWPHMDIWRDGYLWEKGHWVNDKFGICSIASIILEISKRCRINLDNVDVKRVDEIINGVVFSNPISGENAINILRSSYFFDISASKEQKISFIKRGQDAPINVDSGDLLKLSENSYINEANISPEQVLSKVDIYFQNQMQEYMTNYLHFNNEAFSNKQSAILRLPFVISPQEASKIGDLILKNAASENKILQFKLPLTYFDLEPSDFVSLEYNGVQYYLRIVKMIFSDLEINIIAVIDDINNYQSTNLTNAKLDLFYKESVELNFEILELPFKWHHYDFPYFSMHLNSDIAMDLYAKIKNDIVGTWSKIATLEPTNSIAKIMKSNNCDITNFFLIDEVGNIEISGFNLQEFDNDSWKLAKINHEIIAFKNIKKLENEIYSISYFIRGCYGTEKFTKNHKIGSNVIIIKEPNIIPISEDLLNQELEFKVGNLVKDTSFKNLFNIPVPPIITEHYIEGSNLCVKWIVRNFNIDSWFKTNKIPKTYNIKVIYEEQSHDFQTIEGENQIHIDISELGIREGYLVEIS